MSDFFKKAFSALAVVMVFIFSVLSTALTSQQHDFTVYLDNNATVEDCTWLIEMDKKDIIAQSGAGNIINPNTNDDSSVDVFYFDAVADGTVTLTLTYGQHKDGGTIFRTVVYSCESKDGAINAKLVDDSSKNVNL